MREQGIDVGLNSKFNQEDWRQPARHINLGAFKVEGGGEIVTGLLNCLHPKCGFISGELRIPL